jgi:hypothetical protein
MPQRVYRQRLSARRDEAQPTEWPFEAMEQAQININLRESSEAVRTTVELLNKIDQILVESIGALCVVSS